LKCVKQSAAAEQPLTGSRASGEVLKGSGFAPELPHSPECRVYMVALYIIFISLATLKAACRNQTSNWFLMVVVNLARLARSCRWLMHSPELNPAEQVWTNDKSHGVGRRAIMGPDQLKSAALGCLRRLQKMPKLARSFFKHPECSYVLS
jgi:hypothetical protein